MPSGGRSSEEAHRLQNLLEKAKQYARARYRGQEAIDVNTEILDIDPDQIGSYTRRGTSYMAAGDHDMARADFKKALSLDRNNRIAINRLQDLEHVRGRGLRIRNDKQLIPRQTIWTYHFTPIENLSGILESNGLVCNNQCETDRVSIAHQHIQERRRGKRVPCGPGGNLHDYVAFYFCTRSPMMYAVNGGMVASYGRGQEELVYLVVKLQSVVRKGLGFVFTDRHAATGHAAFYHNLTDLRKIDWDLMSSRWWNNIPGYPDREARKQAEFLVHKAVPWNLVDSLAVMTPRMQKRVEAVLAQHSPSSQTPVRVERGWYY